MIIRKKLDQHELIKLILEKILRLEDFKNSSTKCNCHQTEFGLPCCFNASNNDLQTCHKRIHPMLIDDKLKFSKFGKFFSLF